MLTNYLLPSEEIKMNRDIMADVGIIVTIGAIAFVLAIFFY